jgi:KDO2-lipid IV(A) lauroyltransferase
MAATDAESRARPADHLQLWIFRAVECLLGLLPLAVCHALGVACGTLLWAASGRYRRLAARNLRIAGMIDGHDRQLGKLVRRTLQLACANLLTAARTAGMPLDKLARHVELEGTEVVARARAEGRGVINVLSHMGNWELLAQVTWLVVPEGMRPGAIYRPLDNPLIDGLVRRRRASQGTALFSRSDGFHRVTSFLREGHFLGVLSDQRAGHKGVLAPFFGRLSSCTGLPELLARRTGAMLVTTSVVTTGAGRWRIRYREVDDSSTAAVMRALATAMSAHLPDVFWLHDRWRVDRRRPLDFFVKRPSVQELDRVTRPLRLLLSCRGVPPAAAAAVDELLAARPDARAEVLDDGSSLALDWSPRLRRVAFDSAAPVEHLAGLVRSLDRDGPAPLDAVILLDGDRTLARACRMAHLRVVVGASPSGGGFPWTHAEPPPGDDPDAWRDLARDFGAVPLQASR